MEEFKIPFSKPALKASIAENKSKDASKESGNQNESEEPAPTETTHQTTPNFQKHDGPYKEPKWSQPPSKDHQYKFEVLKSGQIIEQINDLQKKAFWLFGRFPDNDIVMAHPTISRYHSVLQYRPTSQDNDDNSNDTQKKKIEEGWYIFDLGSTHGTFLNKMRVPVRTYIRIKVGHMLKLGSSSRNYILYGPEFDEEPESEMSISELKELRVKQIEEIRLKEEMQEKKREEEGISWGISEDADTETDLSINPYAVTNNEELYLDDPKKTLRGFFEREGLFLEYKCDEMSIGSFVCRVELPIDDSNGRPIIAEALVKGKKKECVLQCAMEACRILDRHGVLRQSHHEPLKRRAKADSDDDDDFLDRTGDIERKKLKKSTAYQNASVTYEDLIGQEDEIKEKIADVNKNIEKYQELSKRIKESNKNQNDDLDSFMENLSDESASFDKTEIRRLRSKLQQLTNEHNKIQRLIKIAKPINLPFLQDINASESSSSAQKQHSLPLFGKRDKSRFVVKTVEVTKSAITEEIIDDVKNTDRKDLLHVEKLDEIDNNSIPLEISKTVNETEAASREFVKSPCTLIQNLKAEDANIKKTDNEIKPLLLNQGTSVDETLDIKNEIPMNESDNAISRKKRARLRNRNKREHVDIDDYENLEDSEKYSAWLPPINQSGDGTTSLNDKFGY